MISYKDCEGIIHTKCYNNETKIVVLCNENIMEIMEINGLEDLLVLNLSGNKITEIRGLDKLINLQTLWLYSNQITEIKGLDKLIKLKELLLHLNKITEIKGLDKLINLQYLLLSHNQITEIKGLDNLTSLKNLLLGSNQITEIKGLDKLNNLKELSLNSNQIMDIKGLSELTNLKYFLLDSNKITEIKGVDELTNLQILHLESNQITEIKDLGRLINLHTFRLRSNPIKKIPLSIMNLRRLTSIFVDCDIDTIIERFLDRNKIKEGTTIYDDRQNVHDSHIVKSIQESIYKITNNSDKLSLDKILKEIVDDNVLDELTKEQLIEYCQDKTVHSILGLTFDEVMCSVWNVITEHKESQEIKKILNVEMKDSFCKCFTGRLSRLVNCLNGFDSRVSIKISDKQEILNVIIKVRNVYEDVEKQKEVVTKELSERGYDKRTIDEYLAYLE